MRRAANAQIAQRAVDLEVSTKNAGPGSREVLLQKRPVHPDLGEYDYVKAVFRRQPGRMSPALETRNDLAGLRPVRVHRRARIHESSVSMSRWRPTPSALDSREPGDALDIGPVALHRAQLFCHSFQLPHRNVASSFRMSAAASGGKAGIHLEPRRGPFPQGGRAAHAPRRHARRGVLVLPCRNALTYRIKTGVAKDGHITARR